MTTQLQSQHTMSELLDLTGRVALVTGSGQGIGAATAQLLAAQGAAVAVNDYFIDRAATVAEAITAVGRQARPFAADITDGDALHAMVVDVEHQLGPVDILVNNAGNAGATTATDFAPPPFWESDPSDWAPFIAVNYTGVMLVTHAVLGGMVERGHGRIITVISDAGRVGEPNLVVYSGAKAGAAGFMRAVAKAVGPQGVTANCVALGGIRTPGLEPLLQDPAFVKRALRAYPVGRFGEPADPAALIAFLASDAASWITAQTYPVNGGYSVAQ
jgi:2-hydroxycyclohexanecarboxyl-CoA dehydrogenase